MPSTPEENSHRGFLIPIGGAEGRKKDSTILQRFIKLSGGEPANFLDVGGGADEEMIENAFRILLSDSSVKAILINIFGGILRCDILANGVVAAARKLKFTIPVVVRMEGTNMAEGHAILKESGLNFIIGDGIKDAAKKVVKTLSK